MKQLQLVRVAVGELIQGMYIANLDRAWLDSPFLLEGFLLDDPADLETLRGLCSFVEVDVARSAAHCQPWLLTRVGPTEKPDGEERAPAPRRVTATLIQAPAAVPDARKRDPRTSSLLADLATVARETVRGRAPAGNEGGTDGELTIWRDTDGAAARTPPRLPATSFSSARSP